MVHITKSVRFTSIEYKKQEYCISLVKFNNRHIVKTIGCKYELMVLKDLEEEVYTFRTNNYFNAIKTYNKIVNHIEDYIE